MFPADGAQEPVGGSRPIMVGDGWYSYKDSSDPDARGHARNLASGETITLDGGAGHATLSNWPSVASDQQEIIALDESSNRTSTLTVRFPDAPPSPWIEDG